MSRDAVAVASLLGTFITLWLLTSAFAQQLGGFMALCLTTMGRNPERWAARQVSWPFRQLW